MMMRFINFIIICSFVLLSSCVSPTQLYHNGIQATNIVKNNENSISDLIKQLKPHTDIVGQPILNQISKLNQDDIKALPAIIKENENYNKINDQLEHEKHQWFSDVQKRLAFYIIGGWLVLGVGSILLQSFFPVGILGTIAGEILNFLPLANIFYLIKGGHNGR